MSNLNLRSKGILFILSAPSGGGKTSITKKLLEEDSNLRCSISLTTRIPRGAETEGRDYYFTNKENFLKLIADGEILESAEIYDNIYGTPKAEIIKNIDQGIDTIFDIDWQGARSIKNEMERHSVSIFILPPSLEILQQRLIGRGEDNIEVISKRLKLAQEEIAHSVEYDYIVVNDQFDKTLSEIKAIMQAERLKRIRLDKLPSHIKSYTAKFT